MKFSYGRVRKKGIAYTRIQWQRDGVRKEKYFPIPPNTKGVPQSAKNFVKAMEQELAEHGYAGNLAPKDRADAITARALLDEKGIEMSLTDAVKVAIEVQGTNIPKLAEALEKFMAVKNSEGHTPKHLRGLERTVGLFVALKRPVESESPTGKKEETVFAGKRPSEITTDDVNYFLGGLKSQGLSQWSIQTHLRDLTTFFTWCHESQEWCRRNPAAHAAKQKTKSEKIQIFTPEQAALLLRSCDESIVAAVALQMFCPTRHTEVKRLDWSAIDIGEKVLSIDGGIAKTATRRVMDIPPNALEILARVPEGQRAEETGGGKRARKVMPRNYYRLFDQAKIAAGFLPTNKAQHDLGGNLGKKLVKWPNNSLRHSAISYLLAKNGDIFATATSAGNAPKIIQKHYLKLVKPSETEAYFAIGLA